ncbi:MAG TPA: hypothetical protein VIY68_07855 [Steroidobacteraceae bacterium]
MCRLGIGSEQTSDTISLPRLRPALDDDPVARPAASAAGELCKKKSGAALGAAQPTDKVYG